MKQETKQMQTTYATIGRYHPRGHNQPIYQPVNTDQSAVTTMSPDQPTFRQSSLPDTWQTTKSTHPRDLLTSYPEPCHCGTLLTGPGNTILAPGTRDSVGYEAPKLV